MERRAETASRAGEAQALLGQALVLLSADYVVPGRPTADRGGALALPLGRGAAGAGEKAPL